MASLAAQIRQSALNHPSRRSFSSINLGEHTVHTDTFELTWPVTGEKVTAHLNAAEFFTRANIDAMRGETQIWWPEIVRQYGLLRRENPTGDPAAILKQTLASWPEDHVSADR